MVPLMCSALWFHVLCSVMNNTGTVFWYLDQTYLICSVERLIDDDRIEYDIMYNDPLTRLNNSVPKNSQAQQKALFSTIQARTLSGEFMPPSLTVQFFISWPALVVQ